MAQYRSPEKMIKTWTKIVATKETSRGEAVSGAADER